MKTSIPKILQIAFFVILGALVITFSSCSNSNNGYSKEMQSKIDSLQMLLKATADGNASLEKNLVTFDTLDFTIFSGQEWLRFHESHAKDIIVNWPDGHHTYGLDKHLEDMKAMFVYAPDTRIKQHPIRFGNGTGEWTCVTGIMMGTFSKPMPVGNGKFIQPTGKSFSIPMCTVGHWKDGLMIEESLFWDNQTYMSQLGLGK